LLEIRPLRPESSALTKKTAEPLLVSFPEIDLQLAHQQMASYGKSWHYGYNSIYFIFIRLPLFWIFIPIFFIFKITKIGQFMYKELAVRRKIIPIHCNKESCEI